MQQVLVIHLVPSAETTIDEIARLLANVLAAKTTQYSITHAGQQR